MSKKNLNARWQTVCLGRLPPIEFYLPLTARPPMPSGFFWKSNMFEKLLKASIGLVIETPVALVSDIITMGGAMTEKDEPYTATALKKVFKHIRESTDD